MLLLNTVGKVICALVSLSQLRFPSTKKKKEFFLKHQIKKLFLHAGHLM